MISLKIRRIKYQTRYGIKRRHDSKIIRRKGLIKQRLLNITVINFYFIKAVGKGDVVSCTVVNDKHLQY